MDKITFDQGVQHAKDTFKALGVTTVVIDAIGSLTESDFPTNKVHKLEQGIIEESRKYIMFLEGITTDIDDLKAFTASKRDIAMLEQKIDELILAKDKRDAQLKTSGKDLPVS